MVGLLASTFISQPAAVRAQSQTLQLNQTRAKIEVLTATIGEAAGRTILVPDDVRGTISIVAKRPVSVDEAWSILEASLSILGFSLLPSTVDTWRIAKVADAIGEAPFRRTIGSDSDSYVTTLIPLREATPQEVLKVLEPLSGSRVTLVPFDETNSLIASGPERAIARLVEIADELDQIQEMALELHVLRYREVIEVEAFVETFLESLGTVGSALQVWSDERTNAILIRGDAAAVERVIRFVEDIDRQPEGGGRVQILRVLHRDAEELAELIRSLADPAAAAANAVVEVVEAATVLDGSNYAIAVDGPSHSLVVRSDPETFDAIQELVEILDVPAELIAVDITISELQTPSSYGLAFGFVAPFASGNNKDDLLGVVNSNPLVGGLGSESNILGRIQRDTGVAVQTTDPNGTPISIPILQSATIAAADVKITNEVLIQPSLVVTAGDEHEIFVGANLPVPVTAEGPPVATTTTSLLSQTTNIERRDIGTRLRIRANAGREGKIQLVLDIELSAVTPNSIALGGDPRVVGPSFIDQKVSVTAKLDDGESAVIAMNKRRKGNDLSSGIPFLRDLPFFGWLFNAKGTIAEDTRLVIVARARRVSNPSDLVADTIRRRLTFERRSARTATLPTAKGSPFGVRVTTRQRQDDAIAIEESLRLRGHHTLTHAWSLAGKDYFDVYVLELPSMAEAAEVAQILSAEGWSTDLVVLSERS